MKIIISPAKKMREDREGPPPRGTPVFLDRAERLRDHLAGLPYPELKKLLGCNDTIAELNFRRYGSMDLRQNLTPALLAYEGIQYRYMAPAVFCDTEYEYLEERLRILSGLYGLLRPFDGVTPYRLEMQAKLKTDFCENLYHYWGGALAEALTAEEGVILNLASEEYAKGVRPHLGPEVRFVTPIFGERVGERIVEKGVYVKMARGEMVRYLAERNGADPEAALGFDRLGYRYHPELSGRDMPVFLRETSPRPEQNGAETISWD